jgi:hypothetical protein
MMRDNGSATTITTEAGTPVYLADKPCTACGCYQAYVFECNCGSVHSDVCYNCGGFVDVDHDSIEKQNEGLDMWWAGRCAAGRSEHVHTWPFKEG